MNFKNKLPLIVLLLSILVGAFFRIYKIGDSPIGFYVDEASIGYNAFSILKTGKDEYGKFFPFMFRSFATFQSPVYTYLSVPFIAIFGLSAFSVRLLSALSGILSIPLLYLLVRKISPEKYAQNVALFSALFLSISPWHIMYSRTAYEANVALLFLLLGSLAFFSALKKPWLMIISSVFFAGSFIAYRAETLIVPLLVIALFWKCRDFFTPLKRATLIPILASFIIGTILVLPMVMIMGTPGFNARTSSLNIFSFSLQTPWGYHDDVGLSGRLLNTPSLLSVKEFVSLYSSYFSPRYLFQLGDSGPRKPFPDLGTFYVWQFPFYLVGLYFLLKEKGLNKIKFYAFTLLLISPIPAALTRDPYSTLRSLPMVVPLVIIISWGAAKLLDLVTSVGGNLKFIGVSLLIIFSCTKLFISIFYFNDYYRSSYWNYGWKETVSYISTIDQNLPVVVDASHGDEYILLLFFLGYDPSVYQKENYEVATLEYYTNMNRVVTKHIGRFTVKNFQWGVDTDKVEQLIVADNIAIGEVQIKEHKMTILKEIRFPNGDVALRILKTNPQ